MAMVPITTLACDTSGNAESTPIDIKAMNEDKDRVEEEEIRLKGKLQGKETDEATKAQERSSERLIA